jgi:2-iminobutanoate/2-iminopropanoate deaminase
VTYSASLETANATPVAISTDEGFRFPGISQAVRVGQLVFVGGVISVDPATGRKVPGGAGAEAEQMFGNLEKVLAAAGLTLHDMVKMTMYVRNWDDFPAVDAVYRRRFAGAPVPPARATLAVVGIGSECLCELEGIAVVRVPGAPESSAG